MPAFFGHERQVFASFTPFHAKILSHSKSACLNKFYPVYLESPLFLRKSMSPFKLPEGMQGTPLRSDDAGNRSAGTPDSACQPRCLKRQKKVCFFSFPAPFEKGISGCILPCVNAEYFPAQVVFSLLIPYNKTNTIT